MFRRRIRHSEVGTKSERAKWRMVCVGGVFAILSVASFATHPTAMDMSDQVKTSASAFIPRSLMEVSDYQVEGRRVLFDAAECEEKHRDFCFNGTDNICVVDEEFEGACCRIEEGQTDFKKLDNCITIEDKVCSADELCVAELVPASGVGAQCFRDFEKTGGIALYLFLLLYLFLGLAIVCDDYFAYALDMLGDMLGMSSDVKGATFAAIGSSAPELFVSLADNVISNPPKSVGVGTIVGSAIFNILIIIGASAVVAGQSHGDLKLDWKPLTRDSIFYLISIAGLVGVALTGDEAEWYEGLILLALYGSYLLFMKYNQQIFAKVDEIMKTAPAAEEEKKEEKNEKKEDAVAVAEGEVLDELEKEGEPGLEKQGTAKSNKLAHGSASRRNLKREALGERRSSMASAIGKGQLEDDSPGSEPYWSVLYWPMAELEGSFLQRAFGGGLGIWYQRAYYLLTFPINFTFRISIPDSKYDIFGEDKEGVTNHRPIAYWLEFLMCVVHIAIYSHFLVFSAAKFGCLVGIPASVMGLTVLAAGTSVPDAITSIILTKNGEGDAAVANSIGSNVFDILVGLGLPWFLAGFIYDGSAVATDDITIAIIFLVLVLVVLVGALFITNFHLNKQLGYVLIALYVLYVLFELFIRPATIDKDKE